MPRDDKLFGGTEKSTARDAPTASHATSLKRKRRSRREAPGLFARIQANCLGMTIYYAARKGQAAWNVPYQSSCVE